MTDMSHLQCTVALVRPRSGRGDRSFASSVPAVRNAAPKHSLARPPHQLVMPSPRARTRSVGYAVGNDPKPTAAGTRPKGGRLDIEGL
jgi:hypothetical protein